MLALPTATLIPLGFQFKSWPSLDSKFGCDNEPNLDSAAAAKPLRLSLPPRWSLKTFKLKSGVRRLVLRASDGRKANLTVVVRKRTSPRDLTLLFKQTAGGNVPLLLMAPFLSKRSQELLAQEGVSYADATGNLRLVISNPAVFLESQGAAQDPNRQPRVLRSLKGAASGRVVRGLCDFQPPYGVRTLAEACGTPLGTVSRVIGFLEEEALIIRDEKKQIMTVNWSDLIARWADDYNLQIANAVHSYLEPRGLTALLPKLAQLERYAATGSLAGTGLTPARLGMIYVDDAKYTARMLELVPTKAGANVWLLEPYDQVVFERTQTVVINHGPQTISLIAAAPSQVAVDLMTSPGRGPQEAEALIVKMKATEHVWQYKP